MTRFEGTFQGRTTGDGGLFLLAGGALLLGGGSAAAALSGIVAALAGLLWCVAGVTGTVLLGGSVAWFATRNLRAVRRARVAEALARGQRAREAEIEDRRHRHAIVAAQAQAHAWAPMIEAFAAALRQPPGPQPVYVQSEQQEIQP